MAVALSCSKDNTDDIYDQQIAQLSENDTTNISDLIVSSGIFEGEWRLSKYGKTCEGRIEANGNRITFDIPADYLFPRLSIVTEDRKAMYPEEPLFTSNSTLSYFNTSQTMNCSTQGFSKEATYYEAEALNIVGEGSEMSLFGNYPTFDIKVDDMEYSIGLIGIKEKPTAVFDTNTKLWTVAIPIDQVSIYNHLSQNQINSAYLDEERPDKSAWLLVFRATKRIK
jgi:hypothetical protein